MWEGLLGRWKDEVSDWTSCPSSSPAPQGSFWQQMLSIMNIFTSSGDVARETDDDILCPYHWAQPIQEMNCELVWPKALDQPPYSFATDLQGYDPNSFIDHIEEGNFDEVDEESADGSKKIYLELDIPEYAGVITEAMMVEKLLAQAGIRLAALINWLFASLEVGEGGIRRDGLKVIQL
jgi:hypothetical protein